MCVCVCMCVKFISYSLSVAPSSHFPFNSHHLELCKVLTSLSDLCGTLSIPLCAFLSAQMTKRVPNFDNDS